MKTLKAATAAMTFVALSTGSVLGADPATIKWNSVPVKTLALFYPGQSTYQWLRSPEHPGAQMVGTGGACLTCHKGTEQKLGDKLVKANKLEPAPVEGKNGTVQLNMQVAYDKENAYFRFQWKTKNPYPGRPIRSCGSTARNGRILVTSGSPGRCARASSRPSTKTA